MFMLSLCKRCYTSQIKFFFPIGGERVTCLGSILTDSLGRTKPAIETTRNTKRLGETKLGVTAEYQVKNSKNSKKNCQKTLKSDDVSTFTQRHFQNE